MDTSDTKTFQPIQVLWLCTKCKKTMIQNLCDDPPSHCYDCANEKFIKDTEHHDFRDKDEN